MTTNTRKLVLAAVLACGTSITPLNGALLTNPGFEAGLAGWATADQVGSEGTFHHVSGTTSPVTGMPVQAPPGGLFAAMTDAEGPGSHVLYQDFVVPMSLPGVATARFSLYIKNSAPDFYLAPHLDFASNSPDPDVRLNQRARVDLMLAGSDPFSLAAGDIVMNLFETQPGDPPVSGYTNYSVDVTSTLQQYAGQTLRLRFAEVDNVFLFNFGVDNADIEVAAIPEPSTWIMTAAGVFGLLVTRRRVR